MANRKPSSGRKRSSGSRKKAAAQESFSPELRDEVILWIGIAVTILLFLCNFHLIGKAGNAISGVMFGLFGMLAYIFPLLAFFGILFIVINLGRRTALIKELCGIGLFLILEVFLTLIGGIDNIGDTAKSYYEYGAAHIVSGGWLGGLMAKALGKGLGTIGTVFLLLILMIICIVVMTEKSIMRGIRSGSRRIYDNAREGVEYRLERNEELADERRKRAEQRQVEKEEKEKRRMDKRKVGVTFDTDLTPDNEPADETGSKVSGQRKGDAGNGLGKADDNGIREITLEDMEKINITGLDTGYGQEEGVKSVSIELDHEKGSLANAVSKAAEFDVDEENDAFEEIDEAGKDSRKRTASRHRIEIKSDSRVVSMDDEDGDMDMEQISAALLDAADMYAGDDDNTVASAQNYGAGKTGADSLDRMNNSAPVSQTREPGMPEKIKLPDEGKPPVKKAKPKPYKKPPINLLKRPEGKNGGSGEKELRETALLLQQTLETFKVGASVTDISRGPAVTRYELQPEPGVKVSKIVSLTDDLKLALAATDIRIEAPIPGKSAVGIEVPNKENSVVSLRELIDSGEFGSSKSTLSFAVGKDIAGKTVVADIAKMPHVLIAGSTGSGKSVCINTLIMSILYKATPEEVKLIMIDPKVVELSVYNGIPHLLLPVVTDPKKASAALQWGVNEMMDRYGKFEQQGVRDLKGYNRKMEDLTENNGQPVMKLPQIVIIVDELADLMMVAPGEVEDSICRLAQLARAAGIHLVIATQRPSVDVITGLIKANMPSRIAFAVSSGVDSRTILDMVGAEKLLGKGDMLFYPQGYPKPVRVQGAFVSDKEVADVVDFLKDHAGTEENEENEILKQVESIDSSGPQSQESGGLDERDAYFADAGRFIIEKEKASIGMLQRVFKIGFNRAARIMDQLADYGVVGEEEGTKPRKVLMTMEEFEQLMDNI